MQMNKLSLIFSFGDYYIRMESIFLSWTVSRKTLRNKMEDHVEGQEATEYQMKTPTITFYGMKYDKNDIKSIINGVFATKLENIKQYDDTESVSICKSITDEVKESIKSLGVSRYKLGVTMTMGPIDGQHLMVTSRCLWDVFSDTSVSVSFRSTVIFAVLVVYCLHYD